MQPQSSILIVDDDPYARAMLQQLLAEEGHMLLQAVRGDDALDMAVAYLPDLILLDVMMPAVDGFEVCRRLRGDQRTREIAILLITSLDDRASRLAGLTVGADGFIAKPFDRSELLAQIRTITKLSRYRRLLGEQARFERLIQLSPDGIAILAADSRVLLVNSALTLLLGADNPQQLIGQSLLTYLASDSLDRYHAGVAPLLSGEQHAARIELSMLPIAGPQIPVEVSIGQFADYDGAAFQVIMRDISLRKLAEAQIQRQISQLTSLHAVGVAITASLDLDITLPVLIDRMIEHLHIDAVNLLLLNSMTQLLDPAASRGLACLNSQLPSMRSDEGLPGIAYLTRRPVVISALSNEDLRCDRDRLLRRHFCSYIAIPLQARNQVLGVIEIMQRERFEPDHNWWVFLEALSVQAAIAIDTARLFVQIQHAHQELTLSYNATIEGWSRALDLRDHETEGHSARVTELSLQLARRMNLSDEDLDHVRRGALLHDIGKMGVPDRILLKPGPLSAEEWQVMRLHPIHAYEWLSPIPFLHPALAIPYAHHERWDGSGYPRGLRGEQIPLTARIFAVVDVWDALRSMRPYRTPWPEERVMLHIQSLSGTHFDPQVVGVFLDLIREQREMAREA